MNIELSSPAKAEKAAVFHIVRFKFKSEADPTEIEAAIAQLKRMGREVESVRTFCVGMDVGGGLHLWRRIFVR